MPSTSLYCHSCARSVEGVVETEEVVTCPVCHSGFVEIVENELREEVPRAQGAAAALNPLNAASMDRLLSPLFNSLGLPGRGNVRLVLQDSAGNEAFNMTLNNSGGSRVDDPDRREALPNAFIEELVFNLLGTPTNHNNNNNNNATRITFAPGLMIHGNVGDYVWGRGGLDAIVTELLNQVEGAGPPPMREDNIKRIPTVLVTQEQVDSGVQCSVCWDDFVAFEEVRQLNCEHIFHHNCIVPWLELHGTCPVCRRSQDNDQANNEANLSSARISTSPTINTNGSTVTASLPAATTNRTSTPTMHLESESRVVGAAAPAANNTENIGSGNNNNGVANPRIFANNALTNVFSNIFGSSPQQQPSSSAAASSSSSSSPPGRRSDGYHDLDLE